MPRNTLPENEALEIIDWAHSFSSSEDIDDLSNLLQKKTTL